MWGYSSDGSLTHALTTPRGKYRKNGPLAQLGERQVRNLEVRGSIPLWSTTNFRLFERTGGKIFYAVIF